MPRARCATTLIGNSSKLQAMTHRKNRALAFTPEDKTRKTNLPAECWKTKIPSGWHARQEQNGCEARGTTVHAFPAQPDWSPNWQQYLARVFIVAFAGSHQ